jgi:hypothetical protein
MAGRATNGCDLSTRRSRNTSITPAISTPDITLDFNNLFRRTAMPAKEEAISKRLTSQSLVLK